MLTRMITVARLADVTIVWSRNITNGSLSQPGYIVPNVVFFAVQIQATPIPCTPKPKTPGVLFISII
jgi:hypothetical protein